ncbi:autotransporter outer membrane beta-barrel domain-containing protein [Siculibacillus lacustris]|uniref:Autotransporter outer membrane beta-barrel domain-containing protein n=1 Tax=Siculibacillus lacustris TaxID=1549641 RepID=A0A4Q9VRD5_9HYPH|nr:autotransporter outer membrane beta-barrel domain-containing protein [Siculibacillus lacustris]TBW38444.1 autotransporter outer membrane beta-barrel domain-containing protein [Siculibacillus lacustris]
MFDLTDTGSRGRSRIGALSSGTALGLGFLSTTLLSFSTAALADCVPGGGNIVCDGGSGPVSFAGAVGALTTSFVNAETSTLGFAATSGGAAQGLNVFLDATSSITSTTNPAVVIEPGLTLDGTALILRNTGGDIGTTTPSGAGILGNLTSTVADGLRATTVGGNGDIRLTQGAGSTISGVTAGLRATSDAGNIFVLGQGTLVAGTNGTALIATATGGSVVVDHDGTVVGGNGIAATSTTGGVSVSVKGTVVTSGAPTASTGVDAAILGAGATNGVGVDTQGATIAVVAPDTAIGIRAANAGTSGTSNVSVIADVTKATATNVLGSATGIVATSAATSTAAILTVTTVGTVTATGKAVSGAGVDATSTDGKITVGGTGAITGATGIRATSTSGDIRITGAGTTTGLDGVAIDVTSGGTVTIDRSGTITGSVVVQGGSGTDLKLGDVAQTAGGATAIATGISTSAASAATTITAFADVVAAVTGGGGAPSVCGNGVGLSGGTISLSAGNVSGCADGVHVQASTAATVTVTSATGTGGDGVDVTVTGGAAKITVNGAATGGTGNGIVVVAQTGSTITANGLATGSAANGISSTVTGAGAVPNTVHANGGALGQTNGIFAAGGDIVIDGAGTVTGTTLRGIDASTVRSIDIETTGAVTGKSGGISAVSTGTDAKLAAVVVNGTGAILAGTGTGIVASSQGGNVTVTPASTVTATTGALAIDASTKAAGTITVTTVATVSAPTGGGIRTSAVDGATTIVAASIATATTGTGIAATATGTGTIDVTLSAGRTIGTSLAEAGKGIVTAATTGKTTVTVDGDLFAVATGIAGTSTSGAIDVTIATAATIDPLVGVDLTTVSGALTVTNAGAIVATTTGVKLTASGDGTLTVTNGGTITSQALVDPVAIALDQKGSKTATVTNEVGGVINGGFTTTGGTNAFVNKGIWNLLPTAAQNGAGNATTGTWTLAGVNTFDNSGTFRIGVANPNATATINGPLTFTNTATGTVALSAGSTLTLTNGNFVNQGRIDLNNGTVDNVLKIGGTFSGSGASTIAVDIDRSSTASAAQRADQLQVGGTTSGTTVVEFHDVGGRGLFSNPIVVVQDGGTSAGFVAAPGTLQSSGLIDYALTRVGSAWAVVSTLNPSGSAAAAGSVAATLTSISTGFIEPTSAFITGPTDPKVDQLALAVWARTKAGRYDVSSDTATRAGGVAATNGASRFRTTFAGFQAGVDGSLSDISESGWNAHFGLTAGSVTLYDADRLSATTSKAKVDAPFFGVYTALTGHGVFADLQIQRNYYDIRLTNAVAGLNGKKVAGQGYTAVASTGAVLPIDATWFVEPSVALNYVRASVGDVGLPGGGTIAVADMDSLIGSLRLRVGAVFQATEKLVLRPSVQASVWHEFAGNATALYTDGPAGPTASISTSRVGTFGQIGATVAGQILDTGATGFIRADYRFGEKIAGESITAGLRYQF